MPKPPWIKWWVDHWLDGTARWQLEPDERSVFHDLVNFAKKCRTPGIIQTSDNKPYPYQWLAQRFNISMELLMRAIEKCKQQNRISENDNGLHIVNWKEYQSDERKPPEPLVGVFLSKVNKEFFLGKMTKENKLSCVAAVRKSLDMIEGKGQDKVNTLFDCLNAMLRDPFWGSGKQLQAVRSLPNYIVNYLALKAEGKEEEFLQKTHQAKKPTEHLGKEQLKDKYLRGRYKDLIEH